MSRRQSGFTVIELIVAVAIVAIFAGLALPPMGDLIARNQVATEVNRLVSDLQLARNSAVTRGSVVTMCRSGDQVGCLTSSSANQFDAGWMTYASPDARTPFVATDALLKVGEGASDNMEIRTIGNQAPDFISFLPTGRIDAAAPGNIVIAVCKNGQSTERVKGRRLTLSVSGRPSISEIPVGACT